MQKLTNIYPHVCSPDTPFRDVLARINASFYLFQIVINNDGRLLGTITDGDIRRALLTRTNLTGTASDYMNRKPIAGYVGQNELNYQKLYQQKNDRAFLPIVDLDNRLHEILVAGGITPISTALVMAGGLGTRLGDRTKKTPKPLLEVQRRPILDHILEKLEFAGVPEIWVSVHYLADQIQAFINQRNNTADIRILNEDVKLGTAGALARIPGPPKNPILIINGDVITQVDFASLVDFHSSHNYDGTLGVTRYEHQVPFGVIHYNENGLFQKVEEKPHITHFVAAGIYYLSPAFLSLVPRDKPMDMPDLLNQGQGAGLHVGVFPIHEYWVDVGSPEDLSTAQNLT